jgi:hypothetical protein
MQEILAWMRFINPGMLSGGILDLFSHCIPRLPRTNPIIEISSFAGLSLNHLILFLRHAGRDNLVFSVDEWIFEGYCPGQQIKGSTVSFNAYRDHVIDSFRRNVLLFSGDRLPHHLELSSDAFFAAWARKDKRNDFFGNQARLGGPISFA